MRWFTLLIVLYSICAGTPYQIAVLSPSPTMSTEEEYTMPDKGLYVVINHEEQYTIWPKGRDIPGGWRPVGFQGPGEACLRHVEKLWPNIRPSDRERIRRDMMR